MKKAIKIVAIVLGIVILGVVALAVAVPLLIDPNDYKDKLVQAVKEHTGRELKVEGDINLSVFPWLGVEMEQVSFANAPGFGNEPLAQVQSAGLKVKVLPLLSREVVVDTVRMDGLRLNLITNRAGKTNWDDLMKSDGSSSQSAASGSGIAALTIGGIDIRDGEISLRDDTTRSRTALRKITLKSGNIAPGQAVDLNGSFDLETGEPPKRRPVQLETRANLDLENQTVVLNDLLFQTGELSLNGDITVTQLDKSPQITGRIEVPALDLRALMKDFDVTYETVDKGVLTKLALSADLRASDKQVSLNKLKASLDDSTLSGSLTVRNFAKPNYAFDLSVDEIDIDRYLAPAEDTSGAQDAVAALPLDILRDLNLKGQVKINKLTAFGLHSSEVSMRLSARAGVVTVGPSQATLYGGNYRGQTKIDARQKTPKFSISEKLSGIDLEPFLKDAQIYENFSGTGNLTMNLTARGANTNAVIKTLTGKTVVSASNGKIKGVNLQQSVDDAKAKYDKLKGKSVDVTPKATDESLFSRFDATFNITNGVARNDDLRLQGANIRATGKGTANLTNENINFRLFVTLAEDASRKGSTVPVDIKGTMSQPQYKIAWNEALKAQAKKDFDKKKMKAEEEAKAKFEAKKKKKEDELKEKLKKKLGLD